jgi:hypothetical protein
MVGRLTPPRENHFGSHLELSRVHWVRPEVNPLRAVLYQDSGSTNPRGRLSDRSRIRREQHRQWTERHMPPPELPEGVLAYQEYVIEMPGAPRGRIALTLDDPSSDSPVARDIRRRGGKAHGIVLMDGVPDAPDHAVLWVLWDAMVALDVPEGERVTDTVKRTAARYLMEFLTGLAPTMPWLADAMTSGGLMPGPEFKGH